MAKGLFEGEYKEGKNLRIFKSVSQYFKEERGKDLILGYKYSDDYKSSRFLGEMAGKSLPKCSICEMELYKLETPRDILSDKVLVVQKKHAIFMDSCGCEHKTCLSISRCLKRVSWNRSTSTSNTIFSVPSFEEFLGDEISLISDEALEMAEMVNLSAKESWMAHVVPFLLKWGTKDLNKSNLAEFNKDTEALSRHTIFYLGPRTKRLVVNKILKIIGVEV